MAEKFPRDDVRVQGYVNGDCPSCGRRRLELFVDSDGERAVGLQCEKCGSLWLLDPDEANFHGEHSQTNPLKPPPPDDNNPFGEPHAR